MVLFHAGLVTVSGGFIGVDLFFVLSGYLVTQTLVRDVNELGAIRFGRFYSRRSRRLLPASALALVVTAVLYKSAAAPGQAADAMRSFQASFLYVANWYFIKQSSGYFGAAVAQNPLLHFWSLAVEEQFYVVWPLLLAGLFALGRRSTRRPVLLVRPIILVGAVASLGWALALQTHQPDRAYFGTDTRAYQLLGGALLALTPGLAIRVRRLGNSVRWVGVAALLGLVVLATQAVTLGPIARGAVTTIAALALILALDAVPSGPVHRLLSSEPLVFLGKISYGTYLWHWPVIVLLVTVSHPSPLLLAFVTAMVASGLAALSAQLLELPVRRSLRLDRHRFAVIGVGLAVSLIGALLVAPAILGRPSSTSITAPVMRPNKGLTPTGNWLHLEQVAAERFGTAVHCFDASPSKCTVVKGGGKHILLMGDSNAQMLIPAFTAYAKAHDLTLSLAVSGGCPWQRHVYAVSESVRRSCQRFKEDDYKRVIPALKPDVMVLVNVERQDTPYPMDTLTRVTESSLAQLKAPGRKLVLVEPIVVSSRDPQPLDCLAKAKFVEDCRYVPARTSPDVRHLYAREAEKHHDVRVANFDRLVCPFLPICDPVVGGVVVRWDFQHINAGYSATLGDELAAYFDQAGFLR